MDFSRSETRAAALEGGYFDRFKSAFAIRGLGAGHDRRHELHVQKEIAVPPVSTCSCFTKAESWHAGQTGTVGCESVGAAGFRIGHMGALDVAQPTILLTAPVSKINLRENAWRRTHHDELDIEVRTTFSVPARRIPHRSIARRVVPPVSGLQTPRPG